MGYAIIKYFYTWYCVDEAWFKIGSWTGAPITEQELKRITSKYVIIYDCLI